MEERAQPIAELDVAAEMVRLGFVVQAVFAHVAARHDLTPVQARLLCILEAGPRGMADLAHCLGVEKAALTGLIDRAERRELARRSPAPNDRRALRVTLTETGSQAAAAFHAGVAAELNALASPLATHEQESFRCALAKVLAACQERFPASTLGEVRRGDVS